MARPERRFMFRLALALGFPHPDFLSKVLNSRQVAEWMAYASIEPFGERNRDLSIGILTSYLVNINRDTKKRKTPFPASDFMPPSFETRRKKGKRKKKKENLGLDIFRGLRNHLRKNKEK